MRSRTLLIAAAALLAAGCAAALAWTARPEIPAIAPPPRTAFAQSEIARGAELAAVGDCAVCHTAPHGRPYAGGLALSTPFGAIYSTNITPDVRTGLGEWSEAAFARAMRQGIDRRGRRLYPAFPYDHFSRVSDGDIAALYAFLMTRRSVAAPAKADRVIFPVNIRASVAAWDALFLKPGPAPSEPNRSPDWNRGAYLVSSLGHCGACHAPRNLLGAEQASKGLAGGIEDGWQAPPLDAASAAPVPWTADALFAYLRGRNDPAHPPAAGPMRGVVRALAGASDQDVRAIAVYIASFEPTRSTQPARTAASDMHAAAIFDGACAQCHAGGAMLSTSTAINAATPRNAIQIVLHGAPWEDDTVQPFMPAFSSSLTDKQIAAVLAFARARYSGEPPWTHLDSQVGAIRKQGDKP
jgi:mono/diheme cytochrome c family protein